jgi:bifunctional DNA-binding transcriptional regulator/antitoxin component of YhaV-PrlF toxin-antitoxin module
LPLVDFYASIKIKMKKPSIQFTKPYSKGQITIPLEIRKYLGIDKDTWLLMTIDNKKLVIKPVKEKELAKQDENSVSKEYKPTIGTKKYKNMIVSEAKGKYGEKISQENKQVRREIEEKLKKLDL